MNEYVDEVYHGVPETEGQRAQILVERTQLKRAHGIDGQLLRTLEDSGALGWAQGATFTWGNTGTGPSLTAEVVLTDALGHRPSEELRKAFVFDVVSQLRGEWWLRRGAVLRWARGWCAQEGVPLPDAVAASQDWPVGS